MLSSSLFPRLSGICGLAASLLSFAPVSNATNVLTANRLGSRPPNSTVANVPVEKGKRPGLLLRFSCVDQTTLNNPTNVCFPMQASGAAVQVKIGSNAPLTCGTAPGAPGTCSYSIVDAFQHSNTCGPLSNQTCADTVQIVFNGTFPGITAIMYSASGLKGVSGELENLANLVTFSTENDTPATVTTEFVFDISGSMALPSVQPPVATTPTRMQALQFAAQTPFGLLNSYAIPKDEVGLVFFSTKSTPDTTAMPACGGSGSNLVAADDPAQVNPIAQQVQSAVPTFATSIGAGLQAASTCGFTRDTSGNTNKTVLLFSDGEQNTAPMVSVSTPTGVNGQVLLDGSVYDPSNSIHICPVTAGRLTAPGFTLQQQIANAACSGQNAHIRDTDQTFAQADLQTFFAQALAQMLPTDKLELVADDTGKLVRGSTAVDKFIVSANDVKTTIVLSWFGSSENDRRLPFQVKAPDGTVIDVSKRSRFARNTVFIDISFPLFQGGTEIEERGEWQLLINGAELNTQSVSYHVLVLSDNPTIVSQFSTDAPDAGTGEPIPIQVKLTDDGAPVLNAIVEAQLEGPQNSQGTMLSTAPNPASKTGGDTPSTKGQGKLDGLFVDPANASLFADKTLPTLTLSDAANIGVYSNSFKDTSAEGHYYFSIKVRGKSAVAGDFQRVFHIARFVRSKPDAGKTVFRMLSFDPQQGGGGLLTLQAIPHDALGNFLGPGYERDMHVKSSDGTAPQSPLADKLDGSYEITFKVPSVASNPSYTLEIMGTTVDTKSLSQLRNQRSGRLAAFFDLGSNVPNGALGTFFNKGFSLNAGLEYMVNSHYSFEGIFGYHHFPAVAGTAEDLYQFSADLKTYLLPGNVRPFVNAGIGGYKFHIGSAFFGGNFGGGILYTITPRIGLQGSYNFHVISGFPPVINPPSSSKFSTAQVGLRFVF